MNRTMLFGVFLMFISCVGGNGQNKNTESIKCDPPKYEDIPDALVQQIKVPFTRDGQYYLSDYDGNVIFDKGFDQIDLFRGSSIFIGRIGNDNYIYDLNCKLLKPNPIDFEVTMAHLRGTRSYFPFNLIVRDGDTIALELDQFDQYDKEIALPALRSKYNPDNWKKGQEIILRLKQEGVKNSEGKILISKNDVLARQVDRTSKWILVKGNDLYGLLDLENEWRVPLSKNRIESYGSMHNENFCYEVNEMNGCRYLINDDVKVIHQYSSCKVNFEFFDLQNIPKKFNANPDELKLPASIREFIVLTDGKYSHVFNYKGEYLSSHEGEFLENRTIQGFFRSREFNDTFIPIAALRANDYIYYVRLADGFEYRN